MNTGDYAVIIAILIYFMVVLIIGFSYARRANKSSSEYFLGGRKVGPWFTALSAEASDMSGYLLMGLPGLAYFTGAARRGLDVHRPGTRHLLQLVARRQALAPLFRKGQRLYHVARFLFQSLSR